MDWTNAVGKNLVPRGDENRPVWDGRSRGLYEAWFLTFNVPEEKAAFWLRYSLDAPDEGAAHAELWGHFFDAREPAKSFGIRSRAERDGFELGTGGGFIRMGAAALAEGYATGATAAHGHTLSWELSFEPGATAYFLTPAPIRPFIMKRRTNWCVPNLNVRYRGRVNIDGRELALGGVPGQQSHLFGRRHASRWVWLHCNAFDGGRDALIEGIAPVLGKSGRPITVIYIRYRGRDYLCALPKSLVVARSESAFPEWTFECRTDGLEFVGRARASLDRMLQVQYADPDGTPSFCCNSEIADLEIEVKQRGAVIDTLRATGTANLEFGEHAARADIPLCPGPA
jgi:hypothetical protein